MGTLIKLLTGALLAVSFAGIANASPTIDSLQVQGYMKKANGDAVTDGTYTLAFGVFQNSVNIWGRSYSVTVTNGLFSRTLSGAGGDLSALPGGTGMNSDFTAATLNAALLVAGGSGGITVRVYAVSTIDTANPQFDISYAAVPTAMICESAKGVVAGSVTVAGIATASKVNTSAGAADAGKIPLLDAGGLLATTFIPALPASIITSGSVGIANGGTGSADGSITGSGNVTYMSASGSTTNVGNTGTTSVTAIRSGTGGISAAVTGASGDVALSAGTTSGNISVVAGSAGTVTVGSASTGNSTFGNTGAASVTTVRGGSGAAGQSVVTSAGTGATAVDINTTGVGGGISIVPEATGNLVAAGGATSGTITIGNASTGASIFGNTGAASASTFRSGTGGSLLTSSGTSATAVNITATGVGGGVTIAPEATGAFTVSAGSGGAAISSLGTSATALNLSVAGVNGGITLAPNGTGVVAVSGGNGVQLAGSTSGNVTVKSPAAPTSYTITLPTAVGTSGQVLAASNGTGSTAWTNVNSVGTNARISMFEDFFNLVSAYAAASTVNIGRTMFTSGVAGPTGAPNNAVTNLGVFRLTTVTSVNILGGVGFCHGNGTNGQFGPGSSFVAGDAWTFEARVNISNVTTAAQNIIMGLFSGGAAAYSATAAAGSVNGVYAFIGPGAATVSGLSRAGAAPTVGGATATATAGAWEKWTISYDGAGTVTYSKNGTAFTTAAATIPTGTSLCPAIYVLNAGAGVGAARTIDIDYISFNQTLATPR